MSSAVEPLARMSMEPDQRPDWYRGVPDRRLESRVATVISDAQRAGVPIEYIGIAPTFDAPRQYHNWVIAPVHMERSWREDRKMAVPTPQLLDLLRLQKAGVDFSDVYIAHEFALPSQPTQSHGNSISVSDEALRALDTPCPPPRGVVQSAASIGGATAAFYSMLARALPLVVGGVAAVAVAPVVAAVALGRLDPIVFGALFEDDEPRPGKPAAFFVLARWEW